MKDNNFEIYDDRDLETSNKINLKSKLLAIIIVSLSLFTIALLLWYGYKNLTSNNEDTVKLITADKSEKKIKPQNPGGMEFPDMDKDVFNKFSSDAKINKVERILPAPEEPISRKELDLNTTEDNIELQIAKNKPEIAESEDNISAKPIELSKLNALPQEKTEDSKTLTPQEILKSPKNETQENIKNLPEGSNFLQQDYNKSAIAKTYRVQLSSLKSEREAIKLWDSFVKKAEGMLDNKKYFIEKKMIENKGLFYRLQVANIASESDAGDLCKKLKNKNIDCFIVRPQQ